MPDILRAAPTLFLTLFSRCLRLSRLACCRRRPSELELSESELSLVELESPELELLHEQLEPHVQLDESLSLRLELRCLDSLLSSDRGRRWGLGGGG